MDSFSKWLAKAKQSRLFIISLGLLMVMVVMGTGFSLMNKTVAIELEGETITANTFKSTVGEVLNEAGIAVEPGDLVKPDLDTKLSNNQTIQVFKVFPIAVLADGKEIALSTTTATVEEVLGQAGVTLGPQDRVTPEINTVLTEAANIEVVRVVQKTIHQDVGIPAGVEKVNDATLERGITRTIGKGSPGVERKTILVCYENDKEVSREVVKSEVIKSPVNKVIATGVLTSVSRGGNRIEFKQAMQVRATAYSYAAGSITSTGQKVRVGGIAVDPQVISYGTRVYIEGYGYATAIDCGGAIKGNRIDVFFETEKECRKWGVRNVKLYIL